MEQQILISDIGKDTLRGLSADPKYLLSKYFYDEAGSAIFQNIMQMPGYYLTDCEEEIFTTHKKQISEALCSGAQAFDLIELGSGDGLKTKILLEFLLGQSIPFQYIPIDISHQANIQLIKSLQKELPLLKVSAKTGDYFQEVKKLNGYSGLRKVIFFLGSNIGNFTDQEIDLFLGQLSKIMHRGDLILIGFDLKKSPEVIMKAYDDPYGHTRQFNLNHLVRLDKELNADFNLDHFEHHTQYDPESGAVKSFLVSTTDQMVYIADLGQGFYFTKWEPIFMELSRKFDDQGIQKLAENHGYRIVRQFYDQKDYFVDSLWVKE